MVNSGGCNFDMKDSVEVKIPVPWGHISGKWWGPQEVQPVLVIHGWQDNAASFDKLMPLLPRENSFLCIDLPGHGYSSHYPQGNQYYIIPDSLVHIRRIMKYYGWVKASLMGHSLGAVICFFFAGTFPEDTNYVIAIDSIQPALTEEDFVHRFKDAIEKTVESYDIAPLPEYDYEEAVNILKGQYGINEESCRILLSRGLHKAPSGKFTFSRDSRLDSISLGVYTVHTAVQVAKQVTCKYFHVKPIPGNSFDKMQTNQFILNVVKKSATQFRSEKVKGGHHVHLTDADIVAPVVNSFFQQLKK